MGRLIVALVGLAIVVVLIFNAPISGGALLSAVGQVRSAIQPDPRCDLLLVDGTTAAVTPGQAAALTTAAATGSAVDPATTAGLTPDRLALTAPGGVSCAIPQPYGLPVEAPNGLGLTPRAAAVHAEVSAAFGPVRYGGFAPTGVTTGHGARSAHYQGRAVDYFFRPAGDPDQRARGWLLANWLVANAARFDIGVIIFDDQIWSTRRSAQGWRPYTNPDGLTDPISRHLDHVHMDVIAGG